MKHVTPYALAAAVVCITACEAPDGRCGPGAKCSPPLPPPACELDADTGTRAFSIVAFHIPAPTVGFDVDGLASTEGDLAGCYVADAPDGIDNALAVILPKKPEAFDDPFDVGELVNWAIYEGKLGVEVGLDHWNGTASDPCVGVSLSVTERGIALDPLVAVAPLVDGTIARVAFGRDLALTPLFDTGVTLDVTIRNVLLRLTFDPTMTNVLWGPWHASNTSSMLGGYVRYLGEDGSALRPSYWRLVESFDPFLVPTADNIFLPHLDLDSTPDLSTCTLVDGVPSADAFSMAMMMTSAPSE